MHVIVSTVGTSILHNILDVQERQIWGRELTVPPICPKVCRQSFKKDYLKAEVKDRIRLQDKLAKYCFFFFKKCLPEVYYSFLKQYCRSDF